MFDVGVAVTVELATGAGASSPGFCSAVEEGLLQATKEKLAKRSDMVRRAFINRS